MYQNKQLELLISAYGESITQELTKIICEIQSIYKTYNNGYSRYTNNYISMMESAFNQLKIDELQAKGYAEL